MCGIVGVVAEREVSREHLNRMRDTLVHRGPDAEGTWLAPDRTVGLASRRLAIQDLRCEAAMPMSRAGTHLVFNGEIYNFVELREELERRRVQFSTSSDTEVLLEAYRAWGRGCLTRLNGMFAFALWDEARGELWCARDRMGEKPFHYHWTGRTLFFASEIKALLAHPEVPREPEDEVISAFLAFREMPDGGERTFFRGIRSLPAAHTLVLRLGGEPRIERYWHPEARQGDPADPTALVEEFRRRLSRSVEIRLRSDVPIGSSLSGGIDSSSIVCLIDRIRDERHRQHTFSARYRDSRFDEGVFMDAVSSATRACRHDVFVEGDDLLRSADAFVYHQEQPCPHTSQFAQWKVMELAHREGVTVLLDGQGADELLGGYLPPTFGAHHAALLRSFRLPTAVRAGREFLAAEEGRTSRDLFRYTASYLLPRRVRLRLRATYLEDRSLLGPRALAARPADGSVEAPDWVPPGAGGLRCTLWDLMVRTMLPPLLRFADRNSMAFSRENRLPFLDHTLIEFVLGVPEDLLVRQGQTKWLLRSAMKGVVPSSILERNDKIGFRTPEARWMLGPLSLLLDVGAEGARDRGYVSARGFSEKKARLEHEGENTPRAVTEALWRAVHLELWFRRFMDQ